MKFTEFVQTKTKFNVMLDFSRDADREKNSSQANVDPQFQDEENAYASEHGYAHHERNQLLLTSVVSSCFRYSWGRGVVYGQCRCTVHASEVKACIVFHAVRCKNKYASKVFVMCHAFVFVTKRDLFVSQPPGKKEYGRRRRKRRKGDEEMLVPNVIISLAAPVPVIPEDPMMPEPGYYTTGTGTSIQEPGGR